MKITEVKFLSLVLVLAAAFQPPSAHACDMDQDPHQGLDHSTMQMSQSAGAHSDCCGQAHSNAPSDCAGFMGCGFCVASASMIFSSLMTESVRLHTPAARARPGVIQPSHSSPPYHPPIS
jgi:hypothetical protein